MGIPRSKNVKEEASDQSPFRWKRLNSGPKGVVVLICKSVTPDKYQYKDGSHCVWIIKGKKWLCQTQKECRQEEGHPTGLP